MLRILVFLSRREPPYSLAYMSTFSYPVSSPSTDISRKTYPDICLAVSGLAVTSTPNRLALPFVGFTSVRKIRIVVVLPAPFGPSRPNIGGHRTPAEGGQGTETVRARHLDAPESHHRAAEKPVFHMQPWKHEPVRDRRMRSLCATPKGEELVGKLRVRRRRFMSDRMNATDRSLFSRFRPRVKLNA